MSIEVKCEFPGCEAVKSGETGAVALGLLQLHQTNVHPVSAKQKPPKIERPRIARGSTGEEWATFLRRWEMFKSGTATMSTAECSCQLLACCEQDLETSLFQNTPEIASKNEADILTAVKALAVVDVAATVRVTELLTTRQEHGEGVRAYVARVHGKANICALDKKCTCGATVSYADEVVRWVTLAGLSSPDISREVFGTPDIDQKTLSETVAIIEAKERAARALAGEGSVAAASAYKQEQRHTILKTDPATACEACKKPTPKYWKNRNGKLVEYRFCKECFKSLRPRRPPKNPTRNPPREAASLSTDCQDSVFDVIGSISNCATIIRRKGTTIENFIFDGTLGWRAGESKEQPTLSLKAAIDEAAYCTIEKAAPTSKGTVVQCVTDTGAQSCLMGLKILWCMGLRKADLVPVRRRMAAANGEEITIIGAIFLRMTGKDEDGEPHSASVMDYVSPSTDKFYLSRAALEQLHVIPTSFPKLGAVASIGVEEATHPRAECGCPVRQPTPGAPAQLPFAATEENTEKMRQYLLHRYSASTFNVCPHQRLPTMTGPYMAINDPPDGEPVATSRPTRVPIHWREQVKSQLDRDVALGVIEKVPPGTPVTWLHNMVITPKPDGSPQRTVDLQALNRVCLRETHHTVPPAQQVRAIPPGQLMTVTDAWNGYHAIPIRQEDRHKTTFLTEYGRYRYCRAPMGFIASGDAYTHQYDLIVADIPRLAKVVDDALLHDAIQDRETHWWHVIEYLETVGSNGVILNPSKFQFAQQEVDFTAFRVTGSEVKPLPKYLEAIESFPRPRNITDARSWYGVINQVAHYSQLVELMAPFKHLLSPKTPFEWSDELEAAFQESKRAIIEAIKEGVEIFDPQFSTCLQTDYSGMGIGYWLRQKHCNCVGNTPDCCSDGWRITLAGSRFLRDAEKRYAPIEGECLAVAWALEDTRWFTMGCTNLVVVTDHKPLTKILGDKRLDAITNPRLFRLKQRTMMWRFRITHVPGKANPAADATSRNPAGDQPTKPDPVDSLAVIRLLPADDDMESDIVAGLRSNASSIGVITWAAMQQATQADHDLQQLSTLESHGFPEAKHSLPASLLVYWQYRDRLTVVDGVIMLDSRMVVPQALRGHILQALHSAHQGVSGMRSRVQETVFWPGMSRDIEEVCLKCPTCCRMAPSQPRLPPGEAIPPTYPFQAIAADYFSVQGTKYLVIVDRFSAWPHIMRATKSDEAAGSHGLIRNLKYMFATSGAPEELSSDGGPEFTAAETQEFLERWGVRHRLSAAYHPSSNGRAEVAVKSMKRLLQGHINPDGTLDDNRVVAGLLQYRNTPEPTTGMSPAMILFGRPLRDRIPIPPKTSIFHCARLSPVWHDTWRAREEALRVRFGQQADSRRPHTHTLPPLKPQSRVLVQNQCGPHPTKWDRSGCLVEALPHDQYLVRLDGSGRVTRRNRQHLKHITAFTPDPVGGPIGPLQLAPALGAHVDPPQPAREGTQGAEHVHNPHPTGQAGPPPRTMSCECPLATPKPCHTRLAGYNPDHNPGASSYPQPWQPWGPRGCDTTCSHPAHPSCPW